MHLAEFLHETNHCFCGHRSHAATSWPPGFHASPSFVSLLSLAHGSAWSFFFRSLCHRLPAIFFLFRVNRGRRNRIEHREHREHRTSVDLRLLLPRFIAPRLPLHSVRSVRSSAAFCTMMRAYDRVAAQARATTQRAPRAPRTETRLSTTALGNGPGHHARAPALPSSRTCRTCSLVPCSLGRMRRLLLCSLPP